MQYFLVRKPDPIELRKLPDRSDSDARYKRMMERGSIMYAKRIAESGHIFGPMTEREQLEFIAYGKNMNLVCTGDE